MRLVYLPQKPETFSNARTYVALVPDTGYLVVQLRTPPTTFKLSESSHKPTNLQTSSWSHRDDHQSTIQPEHTGTSPHGFQPSVSSCVHVSSSRGTQIQTFPRRPLENQIPPEMYVVTVVEVVPNPQNVSAGTI
mmetsp:Transcript_9223/g.17414  ORF Transcript_9223/g.17414 Transcript_9223/m.17414 type:complete len:134 (-) Transcript_9223:138-539(-)